MVNTRKAFFGALLLVKQPEVGGFQVNLVTGGNPLSLAIASNNQFRTTNIKAVNDEECSLDSSDPFELNITDGNQLYKELDLSGKDLKNANFNNSFLSGINFSRTNLKGSNFTDSQILDSRFSLETNIDDIDLSKTKFDKATEDNLARLIAAKFYRQDYCDIKFTNGKHIFTNDVHSLETFAIAGNNILIDKIFDHIDTIDNVVNMGLNILRQKDTPQPNKFNNMSDDKILDFMLDEYISQGHKSHIKKLENTDPQWGRWN